MKTIHLKLLVYILTSFSLVSCKKEPYIVNHKNLKGHVIGKENCNMDESKDYWLIDFNYGSSNPKVGDTLVLNGITYTNVLKTTKLDPQLKTLNLRVSIDYTNITINNVPTTSCTVAMPVTYSLKEISIKNQFEIR